MATARAMAWPRLRPYQLEAARAILRGCRAGDGRTISVMVARQGGKNELAAQVELLLLLLGGCGDIIKVAPTLQPQGEISLRRLWERLRQGGLVPPAVRRGNTIGLGAARLLLLSAAPGAGVVGHTAGVLLCCDEAQDVDAERWAKDFAPMAATRAGCQVFYGTPWTEDDLLAQIKARNLELERRDGERRHFEYDWRVVAASNPAYAAFVEGERRRLGELHPAWRTQYGLEAIAGAGRLLTPSQLALLQGRHPRRRMRDRGLAGEMLVAGLDVGGEQLHQSGRDHDATVLTIVRALTPGPSPNPGRGEVGEPALEVVEVLEWRGVGHDALLAELTELLGRIWRPQRLCIDATGVGEGIASALAARASRWGGSVLALRLSEASVSRLGFGLQAAAGGRLALFADDGSLERRRQWEELRTCRASYRPSRLMSFGNPAGHDDYVFSLALAVEAAGDALPRIARGHRGEGWEGDAAGGRAP